MGFGSRVKGLLSSSSMWELCIESLGLEKYMRGLDWIGTIEKSDKILPCPANLTRMRERRERGEIVGSIIRKKNWKNLNIHR